MLYQSSVYAGNRTRVPEWLITKRNNPRIQFPSSFDIFAAVAEHVPEQVSSESPR
jgi:hypothetical protein